MRGFRRGGGAEGLGLMSPAVACYKVGEFSRPSDNLRGDTLLQVLFRRPTLGPHAQPPGESAVLVRLARNSVAGAYRTPLAIDGLEQIGG